MPVEHDAVSVESHRFGIQVIRETQSAPSLDNGAAGSAAQSRQVVGNEVPILDNGGAAINIGSGENHIAVASLD